MSADRHFPGYWTQRTLIVDQFIAAILGRLPDREYVPRVGELCPNDNSYQEILQEAIDGVLGDLDEHLRADLYTRIVTALEARSGTLAQIVTNEVRATQLWSAI